MRVLIVGSGGREHALAWRISSSPLLSELHAVPGNPGIASLATCHKIAADNTTAIVDLARTLKIDLTVIGPEQPLVAGLGDALCDAAIPVFGPSLSAARIEGSKAFAKDVMARAGVPTASELSAPKAPCVVKADGLAGGKGVFVCRTPRELDEGLRAASAFGQEVIVEELLEGPELSVFALCDGRRAAFIGAARDFKRAGDGDLGANTGGMGACSYPSLLADPDGLVATVHQPVLDELRRRGAPFVGCLFAGLIETVEGMRVLEFNARFGDPETQALLPRLEGDLLETLVATARGAGASRLRLAEEASVTVVLTGPDYPASSDYAGFPIAGLTDAEEAGGIVFQGATTLSNGALETEGGRILSVTALASTISDARRRAYAAVEQIHFEGMRYRRDIAANELELR